MKLTPGCHFGSQMNCPAASYLHAFLQVSASKFDPRRAGQTFWTYQADFESLMGRPYMTSRDLGQFLTPGPPIFTLISTATSNSWPPPLLGRDVIYGRSLRVAVSYNMGVHRTVFWTGQIILWTGQKTYSHSIFPNYTGNLLFWTKNFTNAKFLDRASA